MIPIASLITAPQAMRPSNTSALGELGDFLQGIVERDKDRDLKKSLAADENELTRQKIEGTNRYYDMQADTHRMEAETHKQQMTDREEARKTQRMNLLRDALRKAKTPAEQQMIREQIANEIGGTIEELPLPGVPAAAAPELPPEQIAAMSYTPLGAPPGKPSNKISKQTMRALTKDAKKSLGAPPPGFDVGAYMAAQGGASSQPAPGAQSELGGVSDAELGMPQADAELGMPQAAQMPGMPSQPRGSGRFVLKDKQGKIMQIWDEGAESQANRDAILKLMAPYIETGSPEAKAAAQRAATGAADLVGTGRVTLDKGVDVAVRDFKNEMERFRRVFPGSHGGGGGGAGGALPSKQELALSKFDSDEVDKTIRRQSRDFKEGPAQDILDFANQALAEFDLQTGVGDYDAFASWLQSRSGKVVTDRERSAFEGAAGMLDGFMNKMGRWFNGGRFNKEYVDEVREVLEGMRNRVLAKQREMGERTRRSLALAGVSPQGQAMGYGHYTGDFSVQEDLGPGKLLGQRSPGRGAPAKAPPAKSAPAAGGDADERKKKALERARAALGGGE